MSDPEAVEVGEDALDDAVAHVWLVAAEADVGEIEDGDEDEVAIAGGLVTTMLPWIDVSSSASNDDGARSR